MPSPDDRTSPKSIIQLGDLKGAGGVPLFLSAEDRAERLRKCGLPHNWRLMSAGEVLLIDRNMRQLVSSYNGVAEAAIELHACLKLLAELPDGQETEELRERIEKALALPLPQPKPVDLPAPPPPPEP